MILGAVAITMGFFLNVEDAENWSQDELRLLESLSLKNLPHIPEDPSNIHANEEDAAELGHALYFDVRMSGNGTVSCASCHMPEKYFTDGLELAVGTAIGPRHTPTLVGISHSPWFYWDGRKDSQWSQALAPIETQHEQKADSYQHDQHLGLATQYAAGARAALVLLLPVVLVVVILAVVAVVAVVVLVAVQANRG